MLNTRYMGTNLLIVTSSNIELQSFICQSCIQIRSIIIENSFQQNMTIVAEGSNTTRLYQTEVTEQNQVLFSAVTADTRYKRHIIT